MTVEQAARDFFGWFNRHYPAPSTNPDHEWNRLGVALANHQEEAQVRGLTVTNSIHTCSYHCTRPECIKARLTAAQQPTEGEEIMVNTPHGVFTLPLHPSGLSSGPRFVVHVPELQRERLGEQE